MLRFGKNPEGFTLLEILGAVAIIGILMAVIAPNLVGIMESTDDEVNRLQAESIKSAIISAYLTEKEDNESLKEFATRALDDTYLIEPYLQGSNGYNFDIDVIAYVEESFGL